MTQNIILPTLVQWAEGHISTLANTTNRADFNQDFNETFMQDVIVTYNGDNLSRDDYMDQLWQLHFEELAADVNYTEASEEKDANLGEKVSF
jgi:hypothetical protein